jgi:phosphate transport system protein
MADHAAGIARLTQRVGDTKVPVPAEFHQMSDTARQMLRDSMTAFKTNDQTLVRAVVATDNTVDALHRQVYDELLKHMIADPSTVEPCTLMLWVSHNLERIADRVTNICERVIYLTTGELTEYIDPMP